MKLFSHLGLLALVAFSFIVSTAIVAGGAALWSPAHLPARLLARTTSMLARAGVPRAEAGGTRCFAMSRIVAASNGYDYWSDDVDGEPFALYDPDHDSNISVFTGRWRPDFDELTRQDRRPLIWFTRDGHEWVSRDPGVVAKARELLGPVRRLGHEMGEVGSEMGARGARMGRMGGRIGSVAGRLAAVEVRSSLETTDPAERTRLRREARDLRDQMNDLQAQMPRRDARDDELGAQMRELSRRHKAALREARQGMRSLIDEAIRDHKAERLGIGT